MIISFPSSAWERVATKLRFATHGPDEKRSVSALSVIVGGALFAALCLFPHLNDRDLYASHEARAAQNAEYFLRSGHWGLLRLADGTPEYQKPPLYFWLVAGCARLRGGVDEVAVRLPAAIAGWLTVVAITAFLVGRGRPQAGCVAGLTLLTMNHFLAVSRTGRIDVPLTCAITLTILAAESGRPITAGMSLAAALLFKGPVAGVLVAGVLLSRRRFLATSLTGVVGLCLALPWFLAVGVQTDWEFWQVFFWHHNVERAAGTATDLARHPLWFYFMRALIDTLPWSPLFLVVFRGRDQSPDAELRLGVLWMSVVPAILTLSQFKRADYLLPAYPGLAIALGCVSERLNRRGLIMGAGILAATMVAYLGYELWVLPCEDARLEKRTFVAAIRRDVPPGAQVVFFRVEDHVLAWRLGPPIATIREWENLDIWVRQLNPGYLMLPADCAEQWPDHIVNGTLREIARHEDPLSRERPRSWVLFESRPHAPSR